MEITAITEVLWLVNQCQVIHCRRVGYLIEVMDHMTYQMPFVIAPSLLIVTINGTVLVVGYSLNIYRFPLFNLFHREIKLPRQIADIKY